MKMEQLEKTSTPVYKRCCHCKQYKPLNNFWGHKGKRDGLCRACKECEYKRKQTPAYRDCMKKYLEKWRRENPDYFWQWRIKHPDYFKLWALRHPDYLKQWHREHPRYRYDSYCEKQDKFGCHSEHPDNIYPAYRMIKALETAEVVEIKL